MTKVAIVEDNATLRKYLAEVINNTPAHRCVCTCESAEEALVQIPAQKPNVVLMDIHLPGESGIACTARLREKLPNLQVINRDAHVEKSAAEAFTRRRNTEAAEA